MRNSKKRPRPSTRSQGRPSRDLFYQSPTDYSDEETQGIFEFMKKLKQADDETCMFNRFCCAIECYRSGSGTYISLKNRLLSILRGHKGLLDEFHQLKSSFDSPVIRNNEKKENVQSDVGRTVGFLKKIEALGESAYKAFIGALAFPGDMEILVEQLDVILGDHTPLKEEFETFLVDSRLLKRKREESVKITPSYQIRPEAEEGSSSSGGVLNEKYYLVSPYDPEVAWQKKHQRCLNKKRNYLEDKYMKEDMLMGDIAAVIRFGKDALKLFEKPPLGFNRVLDWFCGGKEVPQEYKTHPKRAAICMLPMLQNTHEEMTRAKTSRVISVYHRASQKGNDK
ncbi:uncharacterized protein LOC117126123 [Brassica rapa]|uniref:uncharacterized protein LOC117126123 n=1 Tax=Brassica campestris TaxID=3711 RepID=UPI00142D2AE1|nr:uncharacterized protein LOC117126123 [Brassica rapa]